MIRSGVPESDRLTRNSEWIDLSFVERERTPRPIIEKAIRLHLGGLSLSNTKHEFEREHNVDRSRTAMHDWVEKTDTAPISEATPSQIALDEKAIAINGERYWFFAAVDPATNDLLHVRSFPAQTTQLTVEFIHEPGDKHTIDDAEFLIDGAQYLASALDRLDLASRTVRHGNPNAVERIFHEVGRRTSSFSDTFRNAAVTSAESWPQAYGVRQNRRQT